jgi:hypothetical protein
MLVYVVPLFNCIIFREITRWSFTYEKPLCIPVRRWLESDKLLVLFSPCIGKYAEPAFLYHCSRVPHLTSFFFLFLPNPQSF